MISFKFPIPKVFFNFEMRRLKGSRDVPGRYRVLQTTAMRALASESSEDCQTSESPCHTVTMHHDNLMFETGNCAGKTALSRAGGTDLILT